MACLVLSLMFDWSVVHTFTGLPAPTILLNHKLKYSQSDFGITTVVMNDNGIFCRQNCYFWNGSHAIPLQRCRVFYQNVSLAVNLPMFLFSFLKWRVVHLVWQAGIKFFVFFPLYKNCTLLFALPCPPVRKPKYPFLDLHHFLQWQHCLFSCIVSYLLFQFNLSY